MKVEVMGSCCYVKREKGDKHPKDESHLLYQVKTELNRQGYDLIKKRMQKDGHLMGIETTQYLRGRDTKAKKCLAIYDGNWAIRDAAKLYREEGSIRFMVEDLNGSNHVHAD